MQSFNLLFLLICCQCVLTYAQIPFFRNDYNYSNTTQSFYKIHTIQKSWRGAQEACALEGATLVYPEDGVEAAVVTELLTTTQPTYWWVFVGAHMGKEIYETVDGVPVSEKFSNWAAGEPRSRIGGNCVVLTRDDTIKVVGCTSSIPFVCKKTLASLKWNTPCNMPKQSMHISRNLRSDYIYFGITNSSYKIHKTPNLWKNAMKTCALEGATLLFPEDANEAEMVTEFMKAAYPDIWWVFVGATAHYAKGIYETVDGEPDAAYAQGCAVLTRLGNLRDEDCKRKYPFICKRPFSESNQLSANYGIDYEYNEAVGRCYKFHLNPLSWTDAYATCAAEQSYLAIIDDDVEAQVLANLTARAPTDKVAQYSLRQVVHLGFQHLDEDEGWSTTKGVKLADSGYSHWNQSEPNGNGVDKCGSMYFNGQLNDIGCELESFFICEHEIDRTGVDENVGGLSSNKDDTMHDTMEGSALDTVPVALNITTGESEVTKDQDINNKLDLDHNLEAETATGNAGIIATDTGIDHSTESTTEANIGADTETRTDIDTDIAETGIQTELARSTDVIETDTEYATNTNVIFSDTQPEIPIVAVATDTLIDPEIYSDTYSAGSGAITDLDTDEEMDIDSDTDTQTYTDTDTAGKP